MRPFIIDNETEERIIEVVAYAERNWYSIDQLLDMQNGDLKVPGDIKEHCVQQLGYRMVFSVEENLHRGRNRHLSVSVDTSEKLPNPEVVQFILPYFGFKSTLEECCVHIIKEPTEFINVVGD